jgi:c-di-GMP-binding flagellar brake protein YcgR
MLKVQQKIMIIDPSNRVRYKSLIAEVDTDSLSITVPFRQGGQMAFDRGCKLRVEFAVKDAIYSFEATVINRKKSNQVPLLVINRPTMFSRRQRRDFVRLPLLLPVSFRVISSNDDSSNAKISEVITGKTVDISGGGLQVACSTRVNRNDTILLSLRPEDGNPQSLSLSGTVSWVDEDVYTRTVRFGLNFAEIKELEQERIIKFIFNKMRQRTQT